MIAAAFSLWRAVFLAEAFRDIETIHRSQEAFLEKLITDNAIGFSDDKVNRHWTVEYYLENAKLRLGRIAQFADHHLGIKVAQEVIQNLRLRGTMGIDLT